MTPIAPAHLNFLSFASVFFPLDLFCFHFYRYSSILLFSNHCFIYGGMITQKLRNPQNVWKLLRDILVFYSKSDFVFFVFWNHSWFLREILLISKTKQRCSFLSCRMFLIFFTNFHHKWRKAPEQSKKQVRENLLRGDVSVVDSNWLTVYHNAFRHCRVRFIRLI